MFMITRNWWTMRKKKNKYSCLREKGKALISMSLLGDEGMRGPHSSIDPTHCCI